MSTAREPLSSYRTSSAETPDGAPPPVSWIIPPLVRPRPASGANERTAVAPVREDAKRGASPQAPRERRPASFGERTLEMPRERPPTVTRPVLGRAAWCVGAAVVSLLVVVFGAEHRSRVREFRGLDLGDEPEQVQVVHTIIPAAPSRVAAIDAVPTAAAPCRREPRRAPRPRPGRDVAAAPRQPEVRPSPTPEATPQPPSPSPSPRLELPVVARPSESDELGLMPVPVRPSAVTEQS